MSGREEILHRVRSALGREGRSGSGDGQDAAVGRESSGAHGDSSSVPDRPAARHTQPVDDVVALFAERVADYRAVVVRTDEAGVAAQVRDGLADSTSVVVPGGFPEEWLALPEGCERLADTGLSAAELDAVDAVVTTSTVGIATTGTIVLEHGPGQGRRILTLVPDRHVCIVRASDVAPGVPEAVAGLAQAERAGRALTWISGPSATSDIELSRVEGVHGPRTLHVVIVD